MSTGAQSVQGGAPQSPRQWCIYVVIVLFGCVIAVPLVLIFIKGGLSFFYLVSLFLSVVCLAAVAILTLLKPDKRRLAVGAAIAAIVTSVPGLIQAMQHVFENTTRQYVLAPMMKYNQYDNGAKCWTNNGTLTIAGDQAPPSAVVQCLHTQNSIALTYEIPMPTELVGDNYHITGMRGTFGIDQENINAHSAVVTWDVMYDGLTVCHVKVRWLETGYCTSEQPIPLVNGNQLEITQTAKYQASNGKQEIYAGIIEPVLQINEGG